MLSLVSEKPEKASVICILFSFSSGTVFEFVFMRRSLLTQKGKNIFSKSTALQSTQDHWITFPVTYICKQVVPLIQLHGKAMKYTTLWRLWFTLFSGKLKWYCYWICGHRWRHFKLLMVQSNEYWLLKVQRLLQNLHGTHTKSVLTEPYSCCVDLSTCMNIWKWKNNCKTGFVIW